MSNESTFSFTTKVNGDLFTVRGDVYDEFLTNLTLASHVAGIKNLLDALDGKITEAQAIATIQAAMPATVVSAPTSFQPVAPPVIASTPPVGEKQCAHGVMVKRTGSGAKGEWRAFFCPTPKDTPDQCQAQFAKRGTAEWDSF